MEVIPIGANILRNPPPGFSHERWRSERGLSCSDTLLAYFGFLNSSKGLDDLLRALAALRGEGKGYRLVMVGGGLGSSDPTNRETARRLDALAEDLGVQDALAWTGFLASEEVSAALLSADIAVLPYSTGASFRRGSLMAALEHGLPVITTTPPAEEQTGLEGWPALVDGENALLVPAGDPVALAAAIRRLAGDPALRSRLSAGAGRVAHYFSWERIAEMHLALYARLVGAGDKGNSQGTPL